MHTLDYFTSTISDPFSKMQTLTSAMLSMESQLNFHNVPMHLRKILYYKIENNVFDSANHFAISLDEDGVRQLVLANDDGLDITEDIFLIDHIISFPDSEVQP